MAKIRIKKPRLKASTEDTIFKQTKSFFLIQSEYMDSYYKTNVFKVVVTIVSFLILNTLFLITQFQLQDRFLATEIYLNAFRFMADTWLVSIGIMAAITVSLFLVLFLSKRRLKLKQIAEVILGAIYFGGFGVIMVRFAQFLILLLQFNWRQDLSIDFEYFIVNLTLLIPLMRIYASWWVSKYIVLLLRKYVDFGELIENVMYLILLFSFFIVVG